MPKRRDAKGMPMIDDLIAQAAAKTRLDPAQARLALAGALALIDRHGDTAKVQELYGAVPGAEELAGEGANVLPKKGMMGGLMAKVAGGPAADAMALMGRLGKDGISMEDLKQLLPVAMAWVQARTGRDLLREVAATIPGVGQMLSGRA
jgi:hypothetical protein